MQAMQNIMDVPYSLLPVSAIPQSPPTRTSHDHDPLPFQSPLTSFANQHQLSSDEEDDHLPTQQSFSQHDINHRESTNRDSQGSYQKQQNAQPIISLSVVGQDATLLQRKQHNRSIVSGNAGSEKDCDEEENSRNEINLGKDRENEVDEFPVLPLPEQFEEPTVHHRLDIRWEYLFYKSKGYCSTRRRYLARCKYCDYEIEGRPERLERHALIHCKKTPMKMREKYLESVQRMGKLTIPEEDVRS